LGRFARQLRGGESPGFDGGVHHALTPQAAQKRFVYESPSRMAGYFFPGGMLMFFIKTAHTECQGRLAEDVLEQQPGRVDAAAGRHADQVVGDAANVVLLDRFAEGAAKLQLSRSEGIAA
jgi:hypothetical protein